MDKAEKRASLSKFKASIQGLSLFQVLRHWD